MEYKFLELELVDQEVDCNSLDFAKKSLDVTSICASSSNVQVPNFPPESFPCSNSIRARVVSLVLLG